MGGAGGVYRLCGVCGFGAGLWARCCGYTFVGCELDRVLVGGVLLVLRTPAWDFMELFELVYFFIWATSEVWVEVLLNPACFATLGLESFGATWGWDFSLLLSANILSSILA